MKISVLALNYKSKINWISFYLERENYMAGTIAIGVQDFGELISNNCFYIDKTSFIKEWWDNMDSVTLITRPRRFGKTLTISMLERFFSIQYYNESAIFEHLDIWKYPEYREIMGTYPVMERGLMTGITRVSKESLFSDFNNMEVVTTTSVKYADVYGFTEDEVFSALDEYGLSDIKDKVKRWYDGFLFGNSKDIYNPWSIINLLDKKQLGTYWANTSANGLIAKLIQEGDRNIKQLFETLLKGESIVCEIDEQIIYNQLSINDNAIWSLLLASGYLTVVNLSLIHI